MDNTVRERDSKAALTYLVNTTPFALQDDDFKQLGSMALWVLSWVT